MTFIYDIYLIDLFIYIFSLRFPILNYENSSNYLHFENDVKLIK